MNRTELFKKNIIIFLPVLLFFISFLSISFAWPIGYGDDIKFVNMINEYGGLSFQNIFRYLGNRYMTWTSRLGLEFWIVIFVRCTVFFRVLNSLLFSFVVLIILNKLKTNNLLINFVICCLALFVDSNILFECGDVCTSLNYLWPCIFLLPLAIVIYNYLNDEPISNKLIILGFASYLFLPAWSEAINIPFLVASLFSLGFLFWKTKKINKIIAIAFVISLCFLIFSVTCKGNHNRINVFIKELRPNFPNYSFFDKVNRSVVIGSKGLYCLSSLPTIAFFILLPVVIFNYKNRLMKILSFVPLLFFIIYNILAKCLPFELYKKWIYFDGGISWCSIFLLCLSIFGIIACIFYISFKTNNNLFYVIFFVSSLASICMSGFTPDIDCTRIFYPLIFYFLFYDVYIIKTIYIDAQKNKCKTLS